jgi:hypothetical protein
MNYEQITGGLENLVKNDKSNVLELVSAETNFQQLDSQVCGDKVCKYQIIKLSNFDQPIEVVNQLPQNIFLSGLIADQPVGPTILFNMIKHIASNKDKYIELLNTRMMIFLVIANPKAFYN